MKKDSRIKRIGKRVACFALGHAWGIPLARPGRLEKRICLRCNLVVWRKKPW